MAIGADRGSIQPTNLHEPCAVGLVTEADVELKVITPLLTGANFLEIPIAWIKGKQYLAPSPLDKAAGKQRGYFPDFSVWEKAFPVFIIEAKSPDVRSEVRYREASLYARALNQGYRTGFNPCSFILSTNGGRLLAGNWDSEPSIDVSVGDLTANGSSTEKLREFCHCGVLAAHAARLLAAFRPDRLARPYSRAGDQALINSKKAFNSFAADLSPILRRYFTSASQNNNREIYEAGYVGSEDITEYDRILEALLKDRIAARRGSLTQVLEPTRTREARLGGAITQFRKSRPQNGHMQLITGGVGTGKSLFARRYKELLQPADQVKSTHWSFIDFNTAPTSLASAECPSTNMLSRGNRL